MNIRNERSKLYTIGLPFTALIAMTSAIIALITDPSNTRLLNLQQLFFGAFMLLTGTQYVVIRKNKLGYFLYLAAVFSFIVFISRILD